MKSIFAACVVLFSGAPLAAAQDQDRLVPIEQTVPVSALGYAPLQPGEIAAPEIGYERQTAMFMSSESAAATAEEKAIVAEADRLFKAGQGQAGLDYLMSNVDASPHGFVELRIANFYFTSGAGGVSASMIDGYPWLGRAGDKAPYYWYHVGNGTYNGSWGATKDPVKAAEIWSAAVRKGCSECAEAMGDFWDGKRSGVTVPLEDAYLYTVFALDLGQQVPLWHRLTKILESLPKNPEGVLADADAVKWKALQYSGEIELFYGGLAKATFETHRTGFVSEDVWRADQMIEDGEFGEAFNTIGNLSGASGRYMSQQINKLFLTSDEVSPNLFTPGNMRYARTIALVGGDLSQSMVVGEIYLTGYDAEGWFGDSAKTSFRNVERGAKMFKVAQRNGYYDEQLGRLLAPALAKQAAQNAKQAAQDADVGFNQCFERWISANHLQRETTLANGKKIRNMKFMEVCEDYYMRAYEFQENRGGLQMLNNDYINWLTALNKDRSDWEEKMRSRRFRSGPDSSRTNSYMGSTTSSSSPPSTISSAEAYSNAARNTCSWSMNTSHLCK